ncbi:MAG TPA: FAD-dependent oxidoreductase [Polyangiaceae bacterium]|nr:FAD-dependent oxidoreductase [Polyangiaceae bacterium]
MRHIGIIGAGVAGLTVAFQRERLGDRVSLFEAASRPGGQLFSERSGGFVIEHGAEGFVAGSVAIAELSRSLGIESGVIGQELSDSCHFDGERLIRLGPGEAGRMLGFQVGSRALGKGIQSFLGGMSELAEALHARLGPGATCALGTPIQALRRSGERWQLVPRAGATVEVDVLVVATPAAAAAALLAEPFGAAAAELARSRALSSVTVSLAYPRTAVAHALDATGFVVAEEAQVEGFRACSFVSSKLRGRAPGGHALLRLFFRPSDEELRDLGDEAWVARAERSARRALTIQGAPERSWVSRWPHALPVFDAVHRARVAELEQRLAGSGVLLAGACFHGAGIDGAVRSAAAAARALDA